MFRVHSQRQVIQYSAYITAVSVLAPVIVVGGVLAMVPGMPFYAFMIGLAMASLIPLMIAPPIAYFGLSMLRMMTQTIEQVDAQIRFDGLTGVFNRTHLIDSIRAYQLGGALMIVDADHFKRINDNHGHAAGDAALIVIANAIAQTVGDGGIVGRLGGEEFLAFLPGADPDTGLAVANRICANIRELEPLIEGKRIKLSVSIGLTMHPKSALIGKSLKLADDLLYQAKSGGRDRVFTDAAVAPAQDNRAAG